VKHFIKPNWPAPSHIKAYTTLRTGGVSLPPYQGFNLAEHVGDDSFHVQTNRKLLNSMLSLPNEPIWLEQTHSTQVLSAIPENRGKEADAAFTREAQQICIVLTADCLPLLVCDREGKSVAAIHAGWRGLAHGVIENTLAAMNLSPKNLLVWLGPAIGPTVYEVGDEVRQLFIEKDPRAEMCFMPSPHQRWLANMYDLARQRLQSYGIENIYGGDYCTYLDKDQFYSYRRDGQTGRMASLIYIDDNQ
jgi:YfiH family protein